MLVTQQQVFKRFWYPVMSILYLKEQSPGFELLGQKNILCLDDLGKTILASDRYDYLDNYFSTQLSKS